jgi:DNA gyrase subunit B
MVSALSSSLSAEVRRDGHVWRIELERGRVTKGLAAVGPTDTTGTTVHFKPDASIFAMPDCEVETVARRAREISALLPGLITSFSCEPREYGADLDVAHLLDSARYGAPSHQHAITGEARRGRTLARVAFEWRAWPAEPTITGYCNLGLVPEGTHIRGFRKGLSKGLDRKDHRYVFEALSGGLNAVVSVLVIDPQYQGPTRERIASQEAGEVVRDATALALRAAMELDPTLARLVSERLERGPS